MYEDSKPNLEKFFDEHFKGQKLERKLPAVRLVMRADDGGFGWRVSDTWPLRGTDYRSYFLGAGGSKRDGHLLDTPPKKKGVIEYSADSGGPV